MNIPFNVNGFAIGSLDVNISDTGNGVQISNVGVNLYPDEQAIAGQSQFDMLLQSLPIGVKMLNLAPDEIDAIVDRLHEIKLAKS